MKTIKQLVDSNRICSLPWYSAEVHFQNKSVVPCCKWSGKEFPLEQGFGNIWNGEDFKKLRDGIADLKVLPECHKCNDPNKFSYKDFKNKTLEKFHIEDSNKPITNQAGKIKNLQFSASNICNLACRMCRPHSSSSWGALVHKNVDLKKYVGTSEEIDNKNLRKYIDSLLPEMTEVEYITIGGGEPFMDPIVKELIEYVKNHSPKLKVVSFSSNMTIFNKEVFDLLNDMNVLVQIGVSIDGPRDIHNYIRYLGSFDLIIENLSRLNKEYPKFKFNANTTCSILNAGYIKETLEAFKYIEEQSGIKFTHIKNGIVFNRYLHAGLTPQPYKSQYLDKLNLIDSSLMYIKNSKDMIDTAIRVLKEQPPAEQYKEFVSFIKSFDNIAGTDFEKLYWPI